MTTAIHNKIMKSIIKEINDIKSSCIKAGLDAIINDGNFAGIETQLYKDGLNLPQYDNIINYELGWNWLLKTAFVANPNSGLRLGLDKEMSYWIV